MYAKFRRMPREGNLCWTTQTPAQTKKYDIKSGIVTYDIATSIGEMKVGSKAIVYFDDYRMKE
jgi:hypothetical protein